MIKTYVCKLKSSSEFIWKCKAESLDEAFEFFSKIKQMDLKQFKKIFKVEELKHD